ncbi:hypothetical protein FSP39_010092 [Pinctada imbricata]|uniref:Uncharacterized protein n=1 Tax=Pinctada imbricata TaxID=66713 RepID=A0AA88XDK2_PINIB|nr:hypothetical protein FSP39_010092 [Pinctada imbricata]
MMVGGSSALNLSLLSRGVGEVSKNGHEKIDVVFEPQDYYNFVDSPSRVYLPPIQPSYTFEGPQFSTTSGHSKKPNHEAHIPKTFTTRKGALLLYSEDLAQRTRPTHHDRRSHFHHDHSHHLDERASHLSRSADEIDLRTVDDLAKSILSYGSQFEQYDEEKGMYLKFVHGRRKRDYFDRQIRPGFSAKRYLSSWTKCWDDQVLEKVISKGYLTEKSLFYYNPLMPHLQRRLNDDMSHYPTPYKLMRSMLMSPGSLSGYTFYRVRPESAETIATQDIETFGVQASQDAGASIRVISTKDGVQREVTYASLDRRAQEEVLTDLLVKSAVHYAMKKQQEFMDDSIARAMESGKIQEVPEERQTPVSVPQFDMKDAVESLLDAKKSGKNVLDTDFPDDKSHISEKSGSLRAKPPKHKRHGRDKQVTSRSTSPGGVEEHREYIGNIPVVQLKDGSGSPSSIPQLPQIPGALPLTPIGEASREQTTVVPLPPIKTDGQEEEEWNTGGGYPSKDQEERIHVEVSDSTSDKHKKDKKSMEGVHVVPSGGHSSSESMVSGASGKHGKPQWKGSQQSLKSVGSKKGSGSHEEAASLKGSVIIGPGDEPINVGGSIQPHARPDHVDTVQDANKVFGRDLLSDESDVDEPDEWKHSKKLPRGQRDALKNFANKREIDYTSGDIDATLSINSWSYLPRDSEPEFEGIKKSSSVKSLPIIQDSLYKDITILSRATEKTEPPESVLGREDTGVPPIGEDSSDPTPGYPTPAVTSMSQDPTLGLSDSALTTPLGRGTGVQETPFTLPELALQEEEEIAKEEDVPEEDEDVQESKESSRSKPSKVSIISAQGLSPSDSKMSRSRSQSLADGKMSRAQSETKLSRSRSQSVADGKLSRAQSEKMTPRVPSVAEEARAGSDQEGKKSRTQSVAGSRSQSVAEGKGSRSQSITEGKLSRSQSRVESVLSRRASRQSMLEGDDATQALKEALENMEIKEDESEDRTTDKEEEKEEVFEKTEEGDKTEDDLQVVGEQILKPIDEKEPTPPPPEVPSTPEPSPVDEPSKPPSPQPIEEEVEEKVEEEEDEGQKLSEQQIVDALTDHAQQIANNILSRSNSGRDLEDDVRKAANLWMDTHPVRHISRSQSVQDQLQASIVEEVVESQRRKSAGPTAGEYRELIRENLKTALSSVSGGGDIPIDAEVSPELLDALAKESVSPEDLEVVQDEETGKTVIRSKSQLSMTLGGVKEGHIYVPVAKNGQKVQGSIPDRQSNADIGELAVIHYGEKESVKDESEKSPSEKSVSLKSARSASEKGSKTKSQPPSIMGESIAEEEGEIPQDDAASEKKSRVSFKEEEQEEDEFKKAVEEIEKAEEKSEKSSKAPSKVGSTPDGKKSKASSATEKPPAAPTPKKKEEFVVGKVDTKDDIKALYGQPDPPPKEPSPPTMGKDEKSSKSASTAKQSEISKEDMADIQKGFQDEISKLMGKKPKAGDVKGKPKPKKLPSPPKKAPPAQPAKPKGKGKPQKESVASKPESEESFEFHFVRDSPSPSPPPQAPSIPSLEEEPEDEDEEIPDDEDDEAARLRMISNKEARAAKRAAQAEKRRQEVEKRRREREEQLKREKEEFERQQNLKAELEEERKKAEEARRLRKEKEREEEEREEKEELERARRRKMEEEREKRRKEEYAKKLEEMKKKQLEEEARKHEEMLRKQKEEEERRQAELEMMAQMAEAERIEYERKKKEEEEERLKREEEERKKREEEAQKAMEEARRLAEEMARRQAEMEARLKFTRTLQVEAKGLEHSQDITRAFVFSYFELLQWLGLDIPEFELLKLNQY